jgi:hypothetical protein
MQNASQKVRGIRTVFEMRPLLLVAKGSAKQLESIQIRKIQKSIIDSFNDGSLRVPASARPLTDSPLGLELLREQHSQEKVRELLISPKPSASSQISGRPVDDQASLTRSLPEAKSMDELGEKVEESGILSPLRSEDGEPEELEAESVFDNDENDFSLREREQEDIKYFQNILIKQDTLLYDAALKGDFEMAAKLMATYTDVDQNHGTLGTPLIAAVVSGSAKLVNTLLTAGADPLLKSGPLGCALQAEALLGNTNLLDSILWFITKCWKSPRQHDNRYQESLDKALFSAVGELHLDSIPLLLYVGANPFEDLGGRSTFSIVNRGSSRNSSLAITFVIEAQGRLLLTVVEARFIINAINGRYACPSMAETDPWLNSCCLNLEIGETKMVERRIAERLKQRAKPFSSCEVHCRNVGHTAQNIGRVVRGRPESPDAHSSRQASHDPGGLNQSASNIPKFVLKVSGPA